MATLTVAIDPAVLEGAQREAERRRISLDQLVAESLTRVAQFEISGGDNRELIHLMYEGRLGNLDRPLTREEVYTERIWPRS